MPGIGVYPGSFNPPTVAHIEIALAAKQAHQLSRVDLAVSLVPLGKDIVEVPTLAERISVIEQSVAAIDGLAVVTTEHQLLADIASGYDVVVMGADKWTQVIDPCWYRDEAERDAALARLPRLALAPRPPHTIPAEHELAVAPHLLEVSSSAVRAGRTEWMTAAAQAFQARTGAWTAN